MKNNNKLILKILMSLLLIPLFFVPIVEASEFNVNNQRVSEVSEEYTVLDLKPEKIWVVRGGVSSQKFMFWQESGYRGYLVRMDDTVTLGGFANFEGYIYRSDLPYPYPTRIIEEI